MPEGPTLVILKERIRQFEGKKILAASGYAAIDFSKLKNRKIISVKTWGKHLFICLEKINIEIHLRMFGSYTVNETKKINPKLSLEFARGEFLNFYVADVKLVPDLDAFDWTADVMSDAWEPENAMAKMKAVPDTMICDALMNQNIFAGVGNIIKNEVLWRVKLHPEKTIGSVTRAKLNALMTETVTYSFEFKEQRERGVLSRNWKIYGKAHCPRCGGDVTKRPTGKLKRGSYWCEKCQRL